MDKIELRKQLKQLGIIAKGDYVKRGDVQKALSAIRIEVNPPEARERDVKRNRVLLKIGENQWHLTQNEVKKLIKDLQKTVV